VKGLPTGSVDKIQKELLGVCHLIDPVYLPVVEPLEYQGKTLLIIWAPGGCERPYKCPVIIDKKAKSERAYYIRKLASTVRTAVKDEKRLFELSSNVPFDDRPNMRADIADLKVNLMSDYLHTVGSSLYPASEGMPVSALARDLRVAEGPSECVRPKNVGLMFFSPHPDDFFRCAWIEVVYKPDPTGQGMVEKKFEGPLHIQLQEALAHIKNAYLQEKVFKFEDRAEADRIWNYPYRAVEEALSNAVYHKSYERPEPITVVITPDAMTITSIPGPDESITDDDLKACRLIGMTYRNRRVGDFLKELHMVEGRNTGVPVMVNAMRENRSPMPIFSTPATRAWFSVVLPINETFAKTTVVKSSGISSVKSAPIPAPIPATKSSAKSSVKPSVKSSVKLSESLSEAVPDGIDRHVVVLTSEEELEEIIVTVREVLKRRSISKSANVVSRMARIIQEMRRDKLISLEALAKNFKLTRRTVDTDVAVLRKLKVIKNSGATRNAQWKVLV